MTGLARKAAFLLRKHPVLWAPFIAAFILSSSLSRLRVIATIGIIHWLSNRQTESVLGGNFSPRDFDTAAIATANRWSSLAVEFVNIAIYAAALVLTAVLVGAILRKEQPIFASVAARLRGYLRATLAYSAKIWALSQVLYLGLDWPFYLPSPWTGVWGLGHRTIAALIVAVDIVHAVCYGWIMAFLAMRLLRAGNRETLPLTERRLARYFSIALAVIDQLTRHFSYSLVSFPQAHTSARNDTAYYAIAFISRLPYVFLYVLFALIADPELQDRFVLGDSALPRWMRAAMPLHFRPRAD